MQLVIPKDWHTKAYEHTVRRYKVSIWGKHILCCSCGASTMKDLADLQTIHNKMEADYRAWWDAIQKRNTAASTGTGPWWK